jgi:hypothetical protein
LSKVDRVLLSVLAVDFQRPDSCRVIDRRVLEAAHHATVFSLQECYINLNVMPWDLLGIAMRVDGIVTSTSIGYLGPQDSVAEDATKHCQLGCPAVEIR